MGTVASSAGVADLLQALSSSGSPLASTFSSPAVQSALQNASPADIVKLSDQALQLQETDVLFGVSHSSDGGGSTDSGGNLLAALDASLFESSTPSSGTPSTTSTPSTAPTTSEADQLALAQNQLQLQQTNALFGTNTDPASSNGLLNVLG